MSHINVTMYLEQTQTVTRNKKEDKWKMYKKNENDAEESQQYKTYCELCIEKHK